MGRKKKVKNKLKDIDFMKLTVLVVLFGIVILAVLSPQSLSEIESTFGIKISNIIDYEATLENSNVYENVINVETVETTELQRDIQGFEKIQNPDVKSKMSAYRLNELSPDAMAGLFRGKYMGARSFADINLEELGKRVYVMPADRIKNAEEREERIH